MQRQTWVDGTHEAATVAISSVPWKSGPIGAVNASHVQAWIAAELKRGLAPSTIKTRLNYVQMAFRAAVADRTIAISPAAGVKPPRSRKAEATIRVLGPDEVREVLEAAGDFRGFAEVPQPSGVIKLTGYTHTYRIRVGDFRVIYDVFDDTLLIEIIRVRDRKDVYRGI